MFKPVIRAKNKTAAFLKGIYAPTPMPDLLGIQTIVIMYSK